MSRIFDSDYARMLGLSQPSVRSQLPQVDLEAERSSLDWALERSLGGLGYIGSVLNKPGRAVRGLLDGNLNEGLSWLPLSDSLGITDESNEVTGRDLLSRIGLTTKRQEGEAFDWSDDLLGIGAEILTDPTSFVGFGLNAAGKAAQKSGQLAEGLLSQARAGQRGLTANLPFRGGDPLELLTGGQVLAAGDAARSVGTFPTRMADRALDATLGITPFAGTQRRVYENVGEPLGRLTNRLFAPPVQDASVASGQALGRFKTQVEKDAEYARGQLAGEIKVGLDKIFGDNADPAFAESALRSLGARIEDGGNPQVLTDELTKAARQAAAEKITPWYTPDMDGYAENLSNLRQFKEGRIGLDELTESNRINLDDKLGLFDQSVLKGVLPGGEAMPTSAADLTMLNALRDRIDEGFVPVRSGDNWVLEAGPKVQQADRQAVIDAIAADEQFGPRSTFSPGGVDSRAYRQELRDWAADPANSGILDGDFGDLAKQAFGKLDKMPEYRRTMGLEKAIEYVPPKGNAEALKWAEKNLNQEQLKEFESLASSIKGKYAQMLEMDKSWGARAGTLADVAADYNYRRATQFPAGDPRNNPRLGDMRRDIKDTMNKMSGREDIFDGVPGGTATIDAWSTDPRFSGPNRTMSEEQVRREIMQDLTGTASPAPGNRAWKQAEGLEKWLKGLPEHHAKNGVPFFKADLPSLVVNRQKYSDDVAAIGATMQKAVSDYSRPMEELLATAKPGKPPVSLKEMAEHFGLTGADEKGSVFAQRVLGKNYMAGMAKGQNVTLDNIKHLGLDYDTAKDMKFFNQGWTTPEVMRPLVEAYDYTANLMRTYLTRPFLSFWTRNIASNAFQQARSAGFEGFTKTNIQNLWNFMRGGAESPVPGLSKDDFYKELVAGRIAYGTNTSVNAEVLGKGGEVVMQGVRSPMNTGQSPFRDIVERLKEVGSDIKESGVGGSIKAIANTGPGGQVDNSFIRMVTDGGQIAEDFGRIGHYASLRRQGWAPKAAADEVLKYQIDYSKVLTNTEKAVFRRAMPWLSYSKGTLPVLLEDLVSKPGQIVNTVRAATGGRPSGEFVPGWIGEGAALPLGQNDDGTQRYLASFGLPVEDESFKALGSLVKGDVTRTAEQALGMTFPWFKSPLELLFNKQLSSGRPLTDLKPYEFASLGGVLNDRQARVLTEIAANTPASRTLSTINTLTDPRKDVVDQLVGLGTGVKITDVDAAKARDNAILKMLSTDLLGRPGVKTRTETYVTRDGLPNLSEEDRKRYAAYLAVEQRLRDKAKERRSQQP